MTQREPKRRIPWRLIEPPSAQDRVSDGSLVALDALRREWERHLGNLSELDRATIRQRSLRRLAVETGILERLYQIDWGLTLTLVAEGFTREIVERADGKVDDRTLATLRAQMDSLELVLDFVHDSRSLSPSFIRELHSAITRTQTTYQATDSLGKVYDADLPHGEWKKYPNHVWIEEDTLLEYTPPEHVTSEIDRLVTQYEALAALAEHPVLQAAWLHHRFVQIHPFAGGNGRVARALTLLVLEKHRYAPLVVDRWHREEYVRALSVASGGDLRALTRLFIKLESAALTSELERPEVPVSKGLAIEVAHTLASQLAAARQRRQSDIQEQLKVRAAVVAALMDRWFASKREELVGIFKDKGLRDVEVSADTRMPPAPESTEWFHRQIIESARTAGHYADFKFFAGWSRLRIRLDGVQLRFLACLHGAGRDAGVMAVTTFGIFDPYGHTGEEEMGPVQGDYITTTKDAFRFVHSEDPDEIRKRAEVELHELLDEGLAGALVKLMSAL